MNSKLRTLNNGRIVLKYIRCEMALNSTGVSLETIEIQNKKKRGKILWQIQL